MVKRHRPLVTPDLPHARTPNPPKVLERGGFAPLWASVSEKPNGPALRTCLPPAEKRRSGRRAPKPRGHNSLFTFTRSRYFSQVDLAANISGVRERIAAACARANRDPSSVTLLAVTKTQPPEVVSKAAHLGLTLFGENKVQEAKS